MWSHKRRSTTRVVAGSSLANDRSLQLRWRSGTCGDEVGLSQCPAAWKLWDVLRSVEGVRDFHLRPRHDAADMPGCLANLSAPLLALYA